MTESRSVLVVDDEASLRTLVSRTLKRQGYQVHLAPDGETALAMAREEGFDVVICDVMMPGIGGLETLKRLKQAAPELPVIMASGLPSPEARTKSQRLGAYAYVTKPYELVSLCALLEDALESRPR